MIKLIQNDMDDRIPDESGLGQSGNWFQEQRLTCTYYVIKENSL